MTTTEQSNHRRVRSRNQLSGSSTIAGSSGGYVMSSSTADLCSLVKKRRTLFVQNQQQYAPQRMTFRTMMCLALVALSLLASPATAETNVVINPPSGSTIDVVATETETTSTLRRGGGDDAKPLSLDDTELSTPQGRPFRKVQGTEAKRRVRVQPFLIHLLKTPHPLTVKEYDELYGIIQLLLNEHIGHMTDEYALESLLEQQKTEGDFSSKTSFSADTSDYLSLTYLLLTDIDGVYADPESTTTLTMGEGVAAFYAPAASVPSEDLVDDWVRDAVNQELVQKLANTKYSYVQQATYVSLDRSRSPIKDIDPDAVERGTGEGTTDGSSNGRATESLSVGLVAGVACAGALTLVIVGFLVGKSRQKVVDNGAVECYEDDLVDGTTMSSPCSSSPMSVPPGRSDEEEQTNNNNNIMDPDHYHRTSNLRASNMTPVTAATIAVARATSELECRSMAEMSDSDWTVSTEAGDSAALKSINCAPADAAHGGASGAITNANGMVVVPAVVTAESFEHDRQVSLRKDMLTSPWSGRMPSVRTAQQESVLQPSHFSASQERRLRQTNNIEFDNTSTPSSSSQDDSNHGGNNGSSGDAPFIFRPHTEDVGEEIFIMRGSGGRRGSGGGSELL